MSGALYLEGHDDPISLSSGSGNLSEGYVRPPGASTSNFHHLEAQAAAKMRSTGIMDGHLFISGDYICGACAERLPQMLPEGATLRVTYRDGDGGIQSQLFTGSSG
ncbi:DddA-like double-stranded DNA deaminase toxin [Streptomyces sp. NPDC007851]|uniref:DddA-like double-stranded DNA deaminase toxin n=1 Tax=Streptomyces sp. NPDC007851 TaxID=3155008 RepID=UPI0033C79E3E